ncbi:MAG: hypothetical protein GX102_13390 [Porphyromonadaceae bacterium]|nr:hypothetical protein [Porphyromonadaceae bacterium]
MNTFTRKTIRKAYPTNIAGYCCKPITGIIRRFLTLIHIPRIYPRHITLYP